MNGKNIIYTGRNVIYTLNICDKNVDNIEKTLKDTFNVKFLAYDQYELKVLFVNELSDEEEMKLFEICDLK